MREFLTRQLATTQRRVIAGVLAVLLVVGIVAVGIGLGSNSGPAPTVVTAQFPETPGLYVGNFVDVLGVPVGHVMSIKPGKQWVEVKLSVDGSVRVPANVTAYLMAPNTVNDRYVDLDPAYTSGPEMNSGAVIPVSRTADPVSVDQIIGSLDQLANALGPKGANSSGALSQMLASLSRALGGDGPEIHQTVSSLGEAFGSLSSNSADLTSLIDNIGTLTKAAAQASGNYHAFAGDLASVSTALAGDSTDIQSALQQFSTALAEVANFVKVNGSTLGTSVTNLSKIAAAIGQQQQQLGQLLSVSPLLFQNLHNAIDSNPPGGNGPSVRVRYDPVGNTAGLVNSVCGNSILRLLLVAQNQSNDPIPTADLACGISNGLASLPTPPGASSGPNLSLSALVGQG